METRRRPMKTIHAGQPEARQLITSKIERDGSCIVHTGHEVVIVDQDSLITADDYASRYASVLEHGTEDAAWFYELLGSDSALPANTLEDLYWSLQVASKFDSLDGLPTYGGEEPLDTSGVWSWDETSL